MFDGANLTVVILDCISAIYAVACLKWSEDKAAWDILFSPVGDSYRLASRKFSPCQTTTELEDEDEFEDDYD
jgi:hypothetical protein